MARMTVSPFKEGWLQLAAEWRTWRGKQRHSRTDCGPTDHRWQI